jgi:hypothetical protein
MEPVHPKGWNEVALLLRNVPNMHERSEGSHQSVTLTAANEMMNADQLMIEMR